MRRAGVPRAPLPTRPARLRHRTLASPALTRPRCSRPLAGGPRLSAMGLLRRPSASLPRRAVRRRSNRASAPGDGAEGRVGPCFARRSAEVGTRARRPGCAEDPGAGGCAEHSLRLRVARRCRDVANRGAISQRLHQASSGGAYVGALEAAAVPGFVAGGLIIGLAPRFDLPARAFRAMHDNAGVPAPRAIAVGTARRGGLGNLRLRRPRRGR
jgi:hypothetical protein